MAEAGYLLLEDGRRFAGEMMGAGGVALGEVVFNTSMTGYQEVLTDPSYAGQLVTMTYPLIGNYGVNPADEESRQPQVAGFIVRELPPLYSNWRAESSLQDYLERAGVTGLTEVDTRALTRHIRSAGAMRAGIAPASVPEGELRARIDAHPRMEGLDLTCVVATPEPYDVAAVGPERFRVLAYDFGVKSNSLRLLSERGCRVTTVAGDMRPEQVLEREPDGLFLSNGPGDPDAVGTALDNIQALASAGVPIFGICLGHQLLGLAAGGKTYKLKFGHRGANQPVKDLATGHVEITTQNHGFCVDLDSLPRSIQSTHVHLNDGTSEGLAAPDQRAFSVQYHPEAAAGPHDSLYLFTRFRQNIEAFKQKH